MAIFAQRQIAAAQTAAAMEILTQVFQDHVIPRLVAVLTALTILLALNVNSVSLDTLGMPQIRVVSSVIVMRMALEVLCVTLIVDSVHA